MRPSWSAMLPILLTLSLISCASMDKTIEVTNENDADLPAMADLADPSAARIDGEIVQIKTQNHRILIHFTVVEVKARGSVAPPIRPGKRIEVSIPRSMWARHLRKHTQADIHSLTIKYQGKPQLPEASSAWHWVKFH
ncbi:hypothetical protein KAR48_11530 [bacterium]|nr:hypothetical protein [bacterium]